MVKKKILFLVLAGMLLLTGCSAVESASEKAPDFSLQNVDNRTVRLSNYEGDIIILNFFGTWCRPCISEIPDFIELMDEYGDEDFTIIGISVDRANTSTLKAFTVNYGINYPVLLDDGYVSKTYGPIRSIPVTFIIDREGNIAQKILGARNKEHFEKIIKPLL